MVFRIASSPYTHNQRQTSRIMLPGAAGGDPTVLSSRAGFFRLGYPVADYPRGLHRMGEPKRLFSSCANRISRQPLRITLPLLTGLLLAVSIPPLAPWWMVVLGTAFAVVIAKQLYGGLGT